MKPQAKYAARFEAIAREMEGDGLEMDAAFVSRFADHYAAEATEDGHACLVVLEALPIVPESMLPKKRRKAA